MPPEQRAQMEKMQRGMVDLAHLAEKLKPSAEDPDSPVSMLRVIRALASCPAMEALGDDGDRDDEVLKKLEDGIVAAGQLESSLFLGFLGPALEPGVKSRLRRGAARPAVARCRRELPGESSAGSSRAAECFFFSRSWDKVPQKSHYDYL